MRKIITLLLVILLVGGLCGCRKEGDNTSSITSSPETKSTQSDNSSENSEETNSVESEDSSSSETPTQSTTTDSSKKQETASKPNSSIPSNSVVEGNTSKDSIKKYSSVLDYNYKFTLYDSKRPFTEYGIVYDDNIKRIETCEIMFNDKGVRIERWMYSPDFENINSFPKITRDGVTYYGYDNDAFPGTYIEQENGDVIVNIDTYQNDGTIVCDELHFKRISNNELVLVSLKNGNILDLVIGDTFVGKRN